MADRGRPRARGSPQPVVVDASVLVDLLVGTALASPARTRLRNCQLHAPGHLDAEVLSALGRLHRGGKLSARQAAVRVERLAAAPVQRHPLPALLRGAWDLRHNLGLVDALYVQLAEQLDATLVTSDRGLAAAAASAELITAPERPGRGRGGPLK